MKVSPPTKAIVLAAGFGTRLRPLSYECPKPLLPLWGHPLLEHHLNLLRAWGVRDVLINLHHAPGALLEWLRRHPIPGLSVACSFEPEILGTGGALVRGQWFLDDRPFWVINADIVAALDPAPLIRAYATGHPLAVLWLEPRRGPRTVDMRAGRIAGFAVRRPGSEGTWTFTGLHLVSRRILDYLPDKGFAGIVDAYTRALRKGEIIRGVAVPHAFWSDLGTPENVLDAHREIRRLWAGRCPGGALYDPVRAAACPKVGVTGFVALGQRVTVQPGARLHDVVIGDDVTIEKDAQLDNLIAGSGVTLRGHLSGMVVRAETALSPGLIPVLNELGLSLPEATAQTLGARGSDRTFLRLADALHHVILVQYGTARDENRLYAGHADFLKSIGFPVPRVLHHDPIRRVIVLEDAGEVSLEAVCSSLPARKRMKIYREVLDGVARLHEAGAGAARRRRVELMPAFTPALYRWEREYFLDYFAVRRCRATPRLIESMRCELRGVARRLLSAPAVLIHRDLQSSNILLPRGRPVFIDFQGMRLGAAAYDLASLLCDPYVMLVPEEQADLLLYYAAGRRGAVRDGFWWAAVQRLAQTLGAYARLAVLPGMAAFARHIPSACAMLNRALANLPSRLPALTDFCGEYARH